MTDEPIPLTELVLPDGTVLWSMTKINEYSGIPKTSFSAYVGKRQAPQPTHKVERTRLWEAQHIKDWLANRPGKPGRPRRKTN